MPPVGEGANQAMLDAAELAGELAANPADPDSAIRTYEEAMFTRTHPIAEMSALVQAMMLSPTTADDITRFFTPRPTEPAPRDRQRATQPASPLQTLLPGRSDLRSSALQYGQAAHSAHHRL